MLSSPWPPLRRAEDEKRLLERQLHASQARTRKDAPAFRSPPASPRTRAARRQAATLPEILATLMGKFSTTTTI
eukprot:5600323-Pyramimonas_sp.AAC.1